MGLVFVPTPLGNLRDITLRAIDTLRDASLIVAEDSRVARRLLNALGHRGQRHLDVSRAQRAHVDGRDPRAGARARPSPWSPTPARRGSAIRARRSSPPRAKKASPSRCCPGRPPSCAPRCCPGSTCGGSRSPAFRRAAASSGARRSRAALADTTVWYEAPHRIRESLADLAAVAPDRRVFLVRELSKLHEQQVLGTRGGRRGGDRRAGARRDRVRGRRRRRRERPAGAASRADLDAAIDALLARVSRPRPSRSGSPRPGTASAGTCMRA